VSSLNPALVTQRAARRLPRLALLLLCAAYVLPGVFERDPWRNADIVAFGQMVAIAEGRTPWWSPALGGVAGDAALLPHWLGALSIRLLAPEIDADIAARLPFAMLLVLVMALVWYATFHLARTDAAQPIEFAFGGQAHPTDYARAIADGALLALIATLGLLQLGHETTPELVQLFGVSLFMWALAAAPSRLALPRVAAFAALLILAGSGAPSMGLLIGMGGGLICQLSGYPQARRLVPWLAGATLAAAVLASIFGTWKLRAIAPSPTELPIIARQWAWFLWPAWPLVLWTLWQWRHHLSHRHLAIPLVAVVVALCANLSMGGSDRALMLCLPGMAVLAAFALPTLKRSTSAAIDWFSMFFFTLVAATIWLFYAAMQIGTPAQFARNLVRLLPDFAARFDAVHLLLAMAGTLAWLWLVRWRTGRHREAVWKSMVLPAGGVALGWLLLMTLWLPPLDYARSPRPLVQRLQTIVPPGSCIAAPSQSPVLVASLEVFGAYRVDARPEAAQQGCEVMVGVQSNKSPSIPPAGWSSVASVQGPRDRDEATVVYRRQAGTATR
jgi:4-amino-4-deoxy-L-arabinose transferase-like glycosyltransferase